MVALSYEDPLWPLLMNPFFSGALLCMAGSGSRDSGSRAGESLLPSQAGLYWYKLGVMGGGWRDVKTCSLRTWLP